MVNVAVARRERTAWWASCQASHSNVAVNTFVAGASMSGKGDSRWGVGQSAFWVLRSAF